MQKTVAENEAMTGELEALRRRVAELEAQLAAPVAQPERQADPAAFESLMLKTMLDQLPDKIYFKDTQSRFIRTNNSCDFLFGLKDSTEAVGKTDFDFFSREHAQQAFEDEQRIITTGQPLINIEEKETWPDGRVTWVSTSKLPFRDEQGKIVGTFGLTRDITERKRVELALEEERKLLRTLIDSLPESIFVKDRQGRHMINNLACLHLTGANRQEEVLGKTDFDLYPWEWAEKLWAEEQEIFRTGQPIMECERKHRFPDGQMIWTTCTKVPLHNREGEINGLVGAVHDISAQKEATEKAQRLAADLNEANVEIKKFTYIISHDLRAPLVNLKGFSMELRTALALIRENITDLLPQLEETRRSALIQAFDEDVREALDFINSSVNRMDGFINALLQLSRLGYRELRPEALDMNAIVKETLKTLAHQIEQRKVEVTVEDLPPVVADRTSMQQIWSNLLNNAVVYMQPGRAGTIQVSGSLSGEEAVFQVRDNGRGIRAEDMEKVFAPFRRAGKQDVPGEGMGMSYVQALVRRHGGRITCESQEQVGTVFTFTLSLSQKENPYV